MVSDSAGNQLTEEKDKDKQVASNEGDTTPTRPTTPPVKSTVSTVTPSAKSMQASSTLEDDDDSDWDDEVLDDFNNLKVTTQPPAPISNRPATIAGAAGSSDPVSAEDFDEEAFLKQLEADMMANLMDGNGIDDLGDKPGLNAGLPDAFDPASPGTREAIAKEIEQLSKELTTNGLESDEFLKTLLETFPMSGGNGKGASANPTTKSPGVESSSTGGEGSQGRDKFQDTIERTIERIQESGDRATAATAEDDIPSEIWEKLFKAVQVSAGGDDTEIRNLFMGMMEQMSNKEMLYEPMSELKAKLPSWLEENRSKGTLSAEDLVRIETQIRLVNEVVAKFDEPDYSDDKEEYRSFIWAKMQEMEAVGPPPDDIIPNPLKGLDSSSNSAEMMPPDCSQQ